MSLNLRFPEAPKPEFRSLFEEDSWNAWVAFIHANLTDNGKPLSGALVASANLGDTLASTTKKKRAGDAHPPWSIDQEKALRKLIDEARKQEPGLPRICHTAWSSYPQRDSWYVNVWVHFDVQGKDRVGKAIRLIPNETP